MRRTAVLFIALAGTLGLGAASASAAAGVADMRGPGGEDLGSITLVETPNGVMLDVDLKGLPPGVHGFHIHETGACTPDFDAAGGHLAGEAKAHGFLVEGGPHAGDMPNLHVPESGDLRIEVFNPKIAFDSGPAALFDDDGTAIIIHGGADDYESQPTGHAQHRIACGVVAR